MPRLFQRYLFIIDLSESMFKPRGQSVKMLVGWAFSEKALSVPWWKTLNPAPHKYLERFFIGQMNTPLE
jgi:hypothetical protein